METKTLTNNATHLPMNNGKVSNRNHRRDRREEKIIGFLMGCGPFIGYLLFGLAPMAVSLYVSFTDMKGFDITSGVWCGFDNYIRFFTDAYYSRMLGYAINNTLYYLVSVPLNMLVALFLANLLTKSLYGTKFVRILLFVPSVCSSVGVTLMWTWMLQEYGMVNTILTTLGFERVGFISTSQNFMPSVLLISVWMKGTNILLMQSALANVSTEVKEAARIDGARDMTIFWRIIMPLISPTLFYMLITNLIAATQEMAMMQLIASNGLGPGNSAVTLAYFMYQMSWNYSATQGMGMASALSWMLAVLIMIVTALYFKLSKKWVHYD